MKPRQNFTQRGLIISVIVGVAIGVFGYYVLSHDVFTSTYSAAPQSTSTSGSVVATGATTTTVPVSTPTPPLSASVPTNPTTPTVTTPVTVPVTPTPAAPKTIDTSTWQTFSSYELGFSMEYPSDFQVDTSDLTMLKLTVPNSYFSNEMIDQDSVTVAVTATCTPMVSFSANGPINAQQVSINGINFLKNYQYDIGAGNHGAITTYDVNNAGACYRITFSSRGANDAGLYESDPAKIASVNAAHAVDVAYVSKVVDNMIASFTFISTPAGENEATYAAQSAAAAANPTTVASSSNPNIFIDSVSPTTVSVGDNLLITGQGFLGHDTIVWISNGSVRGVLWGGMPTSDTTLNVPLSSNVCTSYIGASGATCPSYLLITQGIYTVSVANQNGTTDNVYLKVK